MENKKTSELLDLLHTKTKGGNWDEDCTEISDELKSREPFYNILHPVDGGDISETIEEIQDDIKKLKRHKHDPLTNDVMIRI